MCNLIPFNLSHCSKSHFVLSWPGCNDEFVQIGTQGECINSHNRNLYKHVIDLIICQDKCLSETEYLCRSLEMVTKVENGDLWCQNSDT